MAAKSLQQVCTDILNTQAAFQTALTSVGDVYNDDPGLSNENIANDYRTLFAQGGYLANADNMNYITGLCNKILNELKQLGVQ